MNSEKCLICGKLFDDQEPKDDFLNIHVGCRNVVWVHNDKVTLVIEQIFKNEEDNKYYARCKNIGFILRVTELKRAVTC